MMAFDGHIYTKDKKSKDGTAQFWRCRFKTQNPPCKGKHSLTFAGARLRLGEKEIDEN